MQDFTPKQDMEESEEGSEQASNASRSDEKLDFVLSQLTFMKAWCHISTIELPSCGVKGMDWGLGRQIPIRDGSDFMGAIPIFSRNYQLFEEFSVSSTLVVPIIRTT
jgi:hypothetical protein